jgi:Putative auto-transporter adhesin, head GIN domain
MRHSIRWVVRLSVAAAMIAVSGCGLGAVTGGGVTGSGTLKTEVRQVSNFTSVDFSQVGTLVIDQTGAEALTITADDNLLPILTSDVSNGILHLGAKDDTNYTTKQPITYLLSVKTLTGLTFSGEGVTQVHNLNGQALMVTMSGAGSVTVQGKADSQQVTVSGAGSYDGSDFTTKTAKATVSGVGNAIINASDTLDATVSGVGNVEYLGNPTVTAHVSGVGTVKKR